MKILLIDIDSKIPNLALKKIESYYQKKNCEIDWNLPFNNSSFISMRKEYDKIFVSTIFNWNKEKVREDWDGIAEIGGSGWDIEKKLPLEIEQERPKINIGFTSRGCIRKCPFCIVPKKEGKIYIEGDIYDFWDGRSKNITLLDNNILALPDHFEKICGQIKKEKLKIDFNQGLDIRLLTKDLALLLKSLSHIEYHFSFDNIRDKERMIRGINILKEVGIKRSVFYVLVGFNSTIQEDLERLNFLKEYNQNAFVMRYKRDKIYIPMARWANQHNVFRPMTFKQFLELKENKKYKLLYDLQDGVNRTLYQPDLLGVSND